MTPVTLIASAIELALWLVIGVVNEMKDPLPFSSALYVMFPVLLPSIAAFLMSAFRRGPIAAALLAAIGFYFLLPRGCAAAPELAAKLSGDFAARKFVRKIARPRILS